MDLKTKSKFDSKPKVYIGNLSKNSGLDKFASKYGTVLDILYHFNEEKETGFAYIIFNSISGCRRAIDGLNNSECMKKILEVMLSLKNIRQTAGGYMIEQEPELTKKVIKFFTKENGEFELIELLSYWSHEQKLKSVVFNPKNPNHLWQGLGNYLKYVDCRILGL